MPEFNLLDKYPRTKRNLKERKAASEEDKAIASLYGQDYFDGSRNHGYGGYRYDGRWLPVAETIVEHWSLKPGDKVLDVGCAKGFLMKDLLKICPGLEVIGVDISQYGLEHCENEVKDSVVRANGKVLPFPDNSFKAALAINTLHNLARPECITAISELQRVSPQRSYIQVDAYRTPEEKDIFVNWVLTGKTHGYPSDWEKIFAEAGYTGEYYWTIIE